MSKTTDELSVALDQLNCGRTVETNDQEIKDLLEVASLLRNANLPARPPDHLLATSIERASAGLVEHKQSRRKPWLYSGLLGAAAALLVFVGIHGFPSMHDVAQQTVPLQESTPIGPSVSSVKPAPATEKPTQPSTPDASPSSQTTTARSATSPEKPPVVNSPGVVPASPVERTELATLPPPTRSVPAASPSLKSAIPPPPSVEKSLPANSAPMPTLQLPGRTPDSITKDIADGSIRQVFSSGTPQELIITQRRMPQAEKDTARKYSVGPTTINKVVVTINGQEVTLEGRQPVEELAALAKLLKP